MDRKFSCSTGTKIKLCGADGAIIETTNMLIQSYIVIDQVGVTSYSDAVSTHFQHWLWHLPCKQKKRTLHQKYNKNNLYVVRPNANWMKNSFTYRSPLYCGTP